MNPAQVYRALLHQDTMTYWEIKPYPLLIKQKSTEPYYTSTVWAIEKSTHDQGRQTPANQAQVYRTLLDQHSMSYWEINTYLGQTDPPMNPAQVYRALKHQDTMTYWKI